MRITRNDITTATYSATDSVDTEGITAKSWVRGADVRADWQPIGREAVLKSYGIDTQSSDLWAVYCDSGAYVLGRVALKGSITYQCQALKKWYNHDEAIFVPYPVVLPS